LSGAVGQANKISIVYYPPAAADRDTDLPSLHRFRTVKVVLGYLYIKQPNNQDKQNKKRYVSYE
jgi:hypothetical protein